MLGQLELAAMSKNGATVDYAGVPALTQDDAITLWDYFSRAAADNMVAWDNWYPAALCALGYKTEGDKFTAAPDVWLTSDCAAKFWGDWLPGIVSEIETTTDPKPPRDFNPSANTYARWKNIAGVAWARMKKEREAAGKVIPVPIPKKPPIDPVLPPPLPSNRTVLILLVAWLILSAKER